MSTLAALMGSFTQATRLLRLSTPLGADLLLAECVRGEETISNGYQFTIGALSLDAGVSLRALLGQPALLELLTAAGPLRPFHGYLTAVELNGANGGMARYTLTLQPWTAFLARGRDSRVFQDMTVFDILDAVFAPYQGVGKLAPAWRYDVAERGAYPLRSLTMQYQESDLAFAERLMSEEGLFYFFTHSGDPASATLGSHEMVIADHNAAFAVNAQAEVRYTQPGAIMKHDSMDRWRSELRLRTNAVELQSWDYRTRDMRPAGAQGAQPPGAALVSSDAPGPYAYANRSQGERIAEQQIQALEAQREVFTGAGTVRTLAPGTTFTLSGHAHADTAFAVTRTVHLMHNNLSADLQAALHRALGRGQLEEAIATEQAASLHAVGRDQGQRPLYRNRIDAIRASLPFRASRTDGHGRLLHPRPTIRGQQSAIVVGPEGAVIHTDRDHRVKVQFHWQRGADGGMSHSRLAHPVADGHSGAPGDDRAGTWVRVAAPLAPVAGANWGSHALPRVGQEVLVDFLEGNIDRPVIVGALYNGSGARDAQHNQVAQGAGAASGNAGAWFPGDGGAHAHPAVLSGLKTQAMQASQKGSGAYSQLVFDDTEQQARIALQRHAGVHQGDAELNLGHLRHQSDNQRLAPAGFGAELKTANSAALRAAQGLLLSTDDAGGASADQMDVRRAHAQISQSLQLQQTLADSAQQHNAKLKDGKGQAEPPPAELPALAAVAQTIAVLESSASAAGADDAGGGQGTVSAFSEPHLQLTSPAGLAVATPASAVLAATQSTLAAGHDINLAAQGNALHTVNEGISLFTFGKAGASAKPNQETGLRLHAASGKLSAQSQTGATTLTADKAITVASTAKTVTVAAPKHVLLNAMGAYLKLEGGNISVHGPGTMAFKAGVKELTGPQAAPPPPLALPVPGEVYLKPVEAPHSLRFAMAGNDDMVKESRWAGQPFKIEDSEGKVLAAGTVGEDGRLPRVKGDKADTMVLRLGDVDGATLTPTTPARIEAATDEAADAEEDDDDDAQSGASALAAEDDDDDDDDDTSAADGVTGSRYYQEVLAATNYHGSEFLSEAAILEIINKGEA